MIVNSRKKRIIDKIKNVNESWLLKSIEKLLADVEVDGEMSATSLKQDTKFSYYIGNIEEKLILKRFQSSER